MNMLMTHWLKINPMNFFAAGLFRDFDVLICSWEREMRCSSNLLAKGRRYVPMYEHWDMLFRAFSYFCVNLTDMLS